jgi:hypothetical protein
MSKCETCLWDCGSEEESEDCDYYHPIEENEELDAEYIEAMRFNFREEWNLYISGWN